MKGRKSMSTKLFTCKTISIVTDGAPYGRQTAEARTSKTIETQVPAGTCLGTVVETKGKQWSRCEGEFGSLWVHANHVDSGQNYNLPKDQRAKGGARPAMAPKQLTSAELFALAEEARKVERQRLLDKEEELRAMLEQIEALKEEKELAEMEEAELNEAQEIADSLEEISA